MDVRHPPALARATIHVKAPMQRMILMTILVLVYSVVFKYVYDTAGDPYRMALEEIERIKLRKSNATLAEGDDGVVTTTTVRHVDHTYEEEDLMPSDDFDDDFDHAPKATQAVPIDEEALEEEPEFEAEDEDEDEEAAPTLDPVPTAKHANGTNGTNGTNTTGDDEAEPPLPHAWLPSAGAAVALFATLTCHALFHLMCHWVLAFKAATLYKKANSLQAGHHVLVEPLPNRGQPAMCEITRSARTGRLCFEFQRGVYEFISVAEAEALGPDELTGAGSKDLGAIVGVKYPVDLPIREYRSSQGVATADDADARRETFGINRLSIAQPRFLELLRSQLLSPIAMFQLFTAILWLLDEYWQYTLFTLFTIVLLEATTAFQRLRTLGMLSGMAAKPFHLQVYRNSKWQQLTTTDLLPGDLISLKWQLSGMAADGKSAAAVDVVPCDCVLLRGSAVVNEATLTGESVPQMKDALSMDEGAEADRPLDLNGRDRVHVLFSGTATIKTSSNNGPGALPCTPDDGCLAYVLRTGFGSSQGELMRMIEFSQQKVSSDSKETLMALGVLLIFALVSAGYVLKQGLEKKDRTTHELLLKCVIIITSVVPRQLPMQMAFAVNTALMSLMKNGIFCTEPFRVPFAGKVSHCLFDKTGTLTTDQLLPVGIVNATRPDTNGHSDVHEAQVQKYVSVKEASRDAATVLGACHSLMAVEGGAIVGDPIEVAALRGIEWRYDAEAQTALNGNWEAKEVAIHTLNEQILVMVPGPQKEEAMRKMQALHTSLQESQASAARNAISARILHRHHFSSQLQRMSVVCDVQDSRGRSGHKCLVKGSPEALLPLLRAGSAPAWFDATYRAMAEEGMRVLALASKWCPAGGGEAASRDWVESDLQFDGFIAFACKTRADSETVISSLMRSDHLVAMLTGDAPLTALHVAKEVGICTTDLPAMLLTEEAGEVRWVEAVGTDRKSEPFDAANVQELSTRYQLLVTEAAMEAACALDDRFWDDMELIRVFARMSPPGKAKVINALQQRKAHHVLMCGDGGNDVGALKQATVGIALLCGYGNANTADMKSNGEEGADKEEMLNLQAEEMKFRQAEVMATRKAVLARKQKELVAQQQIWIQEELQARAQRGEPGGFKAQMAAMVVAMGKFKDALRREQEIINRMYPLHGASADAGAEDQAAGAMEMQEVLVRPGDASVAAPFTSRSPSVRSVVDLIRQGRCTLLSALQQQQIMMLECIISAYTLSALSLRGARSSERQMMASGWLLSTASLAFSYSAPVQRMHPVRPIRSLFHPAIFISIMGQAAIHVACMTIAVNMATAEMGEAKLQEVLEFHKKMKAGLDENGDEMDTMEMLFTLWAAPFKPNLLNTVVFLVETAQMIAVLMVNYKGRPWMKGVLENHPLFLSLFVCVAGVAACAWGISPMFNELIHLEAFPNDQFRWTVMGLVGASLLGTLLWDRLITAIFAPVIFKAMLQEAVATTLADCMPALWSFGKVFGALAVFASGNPLIWIGAVWLYRKRKAAAAEAEAAKWRRPVQAALETEAAAETQAPQVEAKPAAKAAPKKRR
uniref:P-type ATPase A domain-containing protein n=1 Tax=Eutreptiella gymnastica TaxID=73025 RepID=A0A7S1J4X1_9EUGL|mmetsp:Transcript_67444/g.119580  ORF Transcript_67444/g.119580 Transcript_67444/m.119580 type:complete len:1557 (+) Transcript_67444:29-4699(+)